MKKIIKSLTLVALFASYCVPSWGQAPSTEGRDFWVTFMQAQQNPTELILTISAKESCSVTVENPNNNYSTTFTVADNSSTTLSTSEVPKNAQPQRPLKQSDCYSTTSEQATYTALHVTATKDISLFAGNYISKTFDAANVLPTPALLDDYIIQVYPPSDHGGDNESRGSHFAIVAVEDNTIVDYELTAKTAGGKTGKQTTPTLSKGQVYYVWTGKGVGDPADLSGTTVKARNGKKIAVFQGCPHTNVPLKIRDRDHLFSQAMPTAYWGSEFAITSSLQHRRDIVAVMAINDGTIVYINNEEGDKIPIHTFDFSKDKKHYWTFEIGEEIAYCNDSDNPKQPLDPPQVTDSSCYLTTSCPAGVHLFMVSNKYDNVDASGKNNCDPAMLWISPIEQVIKEINFSTYNKGTTVHYMNIVTATSNTPYMYWTDTADVTQNIQQYFHPIYGNSEYSYARIKIGAGHHHLKGNLGFLAHVYGYGVNESYAYSCGSSTIQQSITFNDIPLMIDSVYSGKFCVNEPIEMKLNIGSNDYESIEWDFGDGVTYEPNPNASNDEKKTASHTYTIPGWYDLTVTASWINACTGKKYDESMSLTFRVARPDTIRRVSVEPECKEESYSGPTIIEDTIHKDCDSVVIVTSLVLKKSSSRIDTIAPESCTIAGITFTHSVVDSAIIIPNQVGCDSTILCNVTIVKCLDLQIINQPDSQHICAGENLEVPFSYDIDGDPGEAFLMLNGKKYDLDFKYTKTEGTRAIGTVVLPIKDLTPNLYTAKIQVEDMNSDNGCTPIAESPLLNITVRYPEDIFAYKFNNVLAVYKKGSEHNKDYEFVAYQWYRNDQPIDGATESIYHTEAPFIAGDSYYVLLTDKNGLVLPSCPQIIKEVADYNPQPKKAQKKLINNRMYIVIDNRMYNAYGQRVQ